jgi:hypothetical protein
MFLRYFMKQGVQGTVTRNNIASPTQQSSLLSRYIPCSHKRGSDDRVTAVLLFHQEWRKCHPKTLLSRG